MMLKVTKINTYYGDSHVLHDVSIDIGKGEIIAILGRNGVGKSTTLKSIIGIASPREGSIVFKSESLIGKPPYHISRMGVGYVPEERRIFPFLTVRENLIMGQKMRSLEKTSPMWTIDKVYNKFPIFAERDKALGGNLSGGEQQLLTLMRTLVGNPDLILIDEPSEGLSPLMVKMVYDIISEIHAEKKSILLVDQKLSFVCNVAERIYIMSKGSVVYSGLGKEVIEDKDIQIKYLTI